MKAKATAVNAYQIAIGETYLGLFVEEDRWKSMRCLRGVGTSESMIIRQQDEDGPWEFLERAVRLSIEGEPREVAILEASPALAARISEAATSAGTTAE